MVSTPEMHPEYCVKEMGECKVIKHGNAYVSISNFHRFSDICQFLLPATSYNKFLTAYGINGKQLQYFCHEWLESYEKLNEQLPPYPSDAWYSSLRDKDILADEFDQYINNGREGNVPATGEEKYRAIQ